MSTEHTTTVEAGYRVRLPANWVEDLGLQGQVVLEKTTEGILVRPCRRLSWEEIFAQGLIAASVPPEQDEEVELTGDDFQF